MTPSLEQSWRAFRLEAKTLADVEWRQGRKQPRNVYAILSEDWLEDFEIAVFATPELAAAAVDAHNERVSP